MGIRNKINSIKKIDDNYKLIYNESDIMRKNGLKKAEAFKVVELLEYVPNSIVIKSIIEKITGSISAISFDSGELLIGKVAPFDTFIEVIEGKAEIVVDDVSNFLETGQSIIIPAHSHSKLRSNTQFKILSTIIKSGYEEVS